jgi:hypothetical protein
LYRSGAKLQPVMPDKNSIGLKHLCGEGWTACRERDWGFIVAPSLVSAIGCGSPACSKSAEARNHHRRPRRVRCCVMAAVCWGTFGCAGFSLTGLPHPRTAATHSCGSEPRQLHTKENLIMYKAPLIPRPTRTTGGDAK